MNDAKSKNKQRFVLEFEEFHQLVDEKIKSLPDGDVLFGIIKKVFESGAGNACPCIDGLSADLTIESNVVVCLSVASQVLLVALRAEVGDGESIRAFIHREAPWCFYAKDARIESIIKCPHNAIDHMKALVCRLESGSIKTGDRLQGDDFDMLRCFGYPSKIVTDGAKLLRLLNDKLVYLHGNDSTCDHKDTDQHSFESIFISCPNCGAGKLWGGGWDNNE